MPVRHLKLVLVVAAALAQQPQQAPSRQVPPQAPQGGEVSAVDDADMQELVQAQKKMTDAYGSLNTVNPLSEEQAKHGFSLPAVDFSKINPNDLPPQLRPFAQYLTHPMVAPRMTRLVQTVQRPDFMKDVQAVSKNPNRNMLFVAMLVYSLFYWLLKRRVLASTDRLVIRFVLKLMLYVVFLTGQGLVAYAFLGQPFLNVMIALGGVI